MKTLEFYFNKPSVPRPDHEDFVMVDAEDQGSVAAEAAKVEASFKDKMISKLPKYITTILAGSSGADESICDTLLTDMHQRFDSILQCLPKDLRDDEEHVLEVLEGIVQDLAEGLEIQVPESDGETERGDRRSDPTKPYHERVWDDMCTAAADLRVHSRKNGNRISYPYQVFLRRHGKDKLFKRLHRGTRESVWSNFVVGTKWGDPEFIHGLEENYTSCSHKGWYFIFLFNREFGEWEWWKLYVGQTKDQRGVRGRAGDHKRNVRRQDENSFLYRT
ncbi:hypothetical protein N0V93_008214 [Gnomoniopsis smithogilvyi]|uniref:Uncharacterized protein n=1 Tax=Gnomoniopsis smithogilvyi TaxID=1191159 RepID=A0A9W9CUJ8_9PEZI|nr:hypothetical protein N0V93_008214 [Gnomoniopsis smithogilvyi]